MKQLPYFLIGGASAEYAQIEYSYPAYTKTDTHRIRMAEIPKGKLRSADAVDEYVTFECVRGEKNRPRVRIITPGYYGDANCMFPRDLRTIGARFRTLRSNVKLITSRSKYYYSTGSRAGIEAMSMQNASSAKDLAVFEDTETAECAICFEKPKDTIIDPCGHFYMCRECSMHVTACPICRGPITGRIDRAQMA